MRERVIVFPGSFDPLTNGHVDIIRRAAALFDRVIVAVAQNNSKKGLLPIAQRVQLAQTVLRDDSRIEVQSFTGLLVDFAREQQADFVLRSLRGAGDVSWELQLASMNRRLAPTVETLFMAPSAETAAISSTLVREIALNHGDVSAFVDPRVAKSLQDVIQQRG